MNCRGLCTVPRESEFYLRMFICGGAFPGTRVTPICRECAWVALVNTKGEMYVAELFPRLDAR